MQPGTVVKPKDLEAMKLGGNGPPKYGILIPNRIFVSGLSADTTEQDLFRAFNFGKIKSARIIFDRSGVSKGYGFVTFETEQDAQIALSVGKSITIKDRELSIAPAIKKSYMVKETTSGHFTPNAAAVSANNAGQLVYAGQYQLDFNAATQAMYQQAAMNQHNVAQIGAAQNHQGLVQGGGMPMFYPQNIAYQQQQQQQQQQQPLYYMPMDLPVYWPPQN